MQRKHKHHRTRNKRSRDVGVWQEGLLYFVPCPTGVDTSKTCTQDMLHSHNALQAVEYLTSLLTRIVVVHERMIIPS